MKTTRLLAASVALTLIAGTAPLLAQRYAPAPYGYSQADESMEHRGFDDGVVGADHDFKNHRAPDVNNRDEYRNPHFISPWGRREYREGFRRGYYSRVHQIYGPAPRYGHRDDDDRDDR